MLKVTREKKTKKKIIGPKRLYNRLRKRPIKELKKEKEEEVLKTSFSDSSIETIEGVARKAE